MSRCTRDIASGLIVPVATPIHADETVVEPDLRKLVRHLVDGGVDGLFVLGTTGEVGALADAERQRALAIVIDENAGRVPVIAGVSAEGTRRVCANIDTLSACKPDAFAATPPYYYPATRQDELLAFYREIMGATDRPFIIYNHPGISGASIKPETVGQLAQIGNCVGLKDASGDLRYFQSLVRDSSIAENIHLLEGNEPLLLPSLLIGGHGGLNGIANVTPRLFRRLLDCFAAGDLDGARRAHAQVVKLARIVYESGDNPLAVIKAGLETLGLGHARLCAPSRSAGEDTRCMLDAAIRQIDAFLTAQA